MNRPSASRRTRGRMLATLALLLPLVPGSLSGQSLLSGYGFGTLLEPLDARAVAMGGIGVGLTGTSLLPQDPSGSADLILPAILFTSRTSWIDANEGGQLSSATSTRFPAVGVMYPIRRVGTVSVSFGSLLDQTWKVSQERILTLEGSGTEARVTDTFDSKGGVSAIRVGVARRIAPSLAVGATIGSYMGDVTRRFTRSFDSLEVETGVPPFQTGGAWEYGGTVASFGATVDLPGVARFGGSFSFGGDLSATPTADSDGGPLAMAMPMELRIGGTALLSDVLSLSAGIVMADWTEAGNALSEVEGQSMMRVGGGLEWSGASLLGKESAIRLGYRNGDLPFHRAGDPDATESMWVGGLGMNLLQSGDDVLAQADFAIERGNRDAGVFTEEFWRLSISVRVSGF